MPDAPVQTGDTATAADDAPAGAAGAALEAPPAPVGGTQAAVDAARARLAGTGTILPEAPVETAEEKATREAAEAAPAGDHADETDEEKTAREADEIAAGETDEQKAAREAADAEAASADAEHPELAFTLPGMAERGEEDLVIEAPDKETLARLNRQANEAALGRSVKQERRAIERQFDKLEAVEDQIAMDPAGFVLDRVEDAIRPDLALHILLDPGVLETVQERLVKAGVEGGLVALLDNPDALRVQRAELKASRLEMREQLRTQAETRKQTRANAQRVAGQIEAMIPETVQGEERERLYNETVAAVSATCRKYGITDIAPEDLVLFVGDRFRQQGIAAAPVRQAGGNGKPAATPPARPAPTAEQLKQAQDVRRRAAAAAPAGAGAPPAKPRPTLPPTTDGRIAAARKFGLRALLGKS